MRITREPDHVALYTVSEARPEDPDDVVRMGPGGRRRLGAEGGFAGVVDSRVPHPTISEKRAETEGEFIERLRDDGAQHGSSSSRHTAARSSSTPTGRPSGSARVWA